MQRVLPGGAFAPRPGLRALFAADALMLRSDDADALQLPPFALAWSDAAQGVWSIAAETPVRAWWMHFEPNP
jgi:hypothetical protein